MKYGGAVTFLGAIATTLKSSHNGNSAFPDGRPPGNVGNTMTADNKLVSRSTVLAVWLRPLVDYLERNGFDSRAVFAHTGVDVEQVFVPGVRLLLSDAAPLWRHAAQVTGKAFIGLEIAGDAPPLQADTMAIAMMASRNLYEALQRFSRLSHAVCNAVEVELSREGMELRLDFIVHPEDRDIMPREAMDPALLIPLGLLDKGMFSAGAISEMRFDCEYPGAALMEHIAEIFPLPMHFGCVHYGLSFDWELALRQNPYWNPALAQMSEQLVLQDLEALGDDNLIARTRKIVLDQLASGTPKLGIVASRFNITERQLQRKLKGQGSSFGELLDQVRLDLALRYLQDPRMTMVDISLSLGFHDQSNFVKAFKRWQGETPGHYRSRTVS
jgi:AraC-like DNA-binding protein